MQNGRIRANQLTASSSWDKNHAPSYGRLHFRRAGHRVGAWCSRHNNRLQWFQVYFGRPTRVVKFATQGRQDARQWVTQYYLTFSQDGVHSAEYKENSNRKVHHNCSLKFFKRSFFPNSGTCVETEIEANRDVSFKNIPHEVYLLYVPWLLFHQTCVQGKAKLII